MRIIKLVLIVSLLVIFLSPPKSVLGQTADTTLSLALDSYTQTNETETGQLFAVTVTVDVPTSNPVAGIDFTLKYDSTKIQAMKVLPGDKAEFTNGYFGISSIVDQAGSPCKASPGDQTERLKCAIDNGTGIVAISAINLAGADFQTVDSSYSNPMVSGNFTLATVIFMAENIGPTGNILIDITDNRSNAYSHVDLNGSTNSVQTLSSTAPAPASITTTDKTTCSADFNRNNDIDFVDLGIVSQDISQNCSAVFCRTDFDYNGDIDFTDLGRVSLEISNKNC
ncbi:hypothetical protein COW99_05870 [Candidatus Roizmanbacteria bacterium CG22_combo_CG10-13_8_21_14_all_38_20]|uniref:Cohesin domain-containing protein n=1 Tax=Candidatus Roizmanbacteria bacterium CG22_combo_CG10-13_8_21_14_all_38_20 TaxID=1974862 RepID=A0A2H0BU20_9BACT|nr:MAG: hypothetical protein COW99_05870 [Candidatus Roizmanbacteria bacterium CG22_combo_CG10-13_8_21_14_all_38_20]PJC32223.1 MAG: hypothetical protein CO050_00590 [Candidatus Roizmanbacteria bacterium CG_4_9_14_0_2_um_filter_38_17]